MNRAIEILLEKGGAWGIIAFLSLGALWFVYRTKTAEVAAVRKQLDAEHAARLVDAKENTKTMMTIQERVLDAIRSMKDLVDLSKRSQR